MKENRLPQNGKEGMLYGGIICIITVIVMLTLNIGLEFKNFDQSTILIIIKSIPLIWIIAMLLETLLIGKISNKLVNKFTNSNDGFNTKILFNILFCVTGMSAVMTIVGSMIGAGSINIESFLNFPNHWPRNFFVAFWCEILLAQPFARFVMTKIHKSKI